MLHNICINLKTVSSDLSEFKLIGDSVCTQRTLCQSVFMVKDIAANQASLRQPTGSELIWQDAGSGAGSNLAIYRLIPPEGYQCLGHVTVGWPNGSPTHSPPDLNDFVCVKNDYLTRVKYKSVVWDSRGTGE